MARKQNRLWLRVVVVLGFVASCQAYRAGGPFGCERGIPTWLSQGSGAFVQDDEAVLLGIGVASGIRNTALARSTAENRARAEVARMYEAYMDSVLKGCPTWETAAPLPSEAPQQEPLSIEQVNKLLTAAALNSAEAKAYWYSQKDGDVYVLVSLPVQKIVEMLPKLGQLSEPVRTYIAQQVLQVHRQWTAMPRHQPDVYPTTSWQTQEHG